MSESLQQAMPHSCTTRWKFPPLPRAAGWIIAAAAGILALSCSSEPARRAASNPAFAGVLVQQWILRNPLPDAQARALVPFEGRLQSAAVAPGQGDALERLRAAGLRILVVPESSITPILIELSAKPSATERNVAQSPSWTPFIAGPPWNTSRRVLVHDGTMEIPAGRFRIMGRAFVAPGTQEVHAAGGEMSVRTALRIDLIPQLEQSPDRTRNEAFSLESPRLRTLDDEGQLFTTLAIELLVPPGDAIIVLAESPDANWSALRASLAPTLDPGTAPAAEDHADASEGPSAAPPPPPAPAAPPKTAVPMHGILPNAPLTIEFPAIGPKPPAVRTLGELTLTDATDLAPPATRILLVLIPRVPPEFRLLP